MSVLVGKKAPSFEAMTVFAGEFKKISLEDYRGQYVILFFYPLDFTFVCPTELHAFQEKLDVFTRLGSTVLACSVDSHFTHKAWLETPKIKGGIEGIKYGLISDIGGKIAKEYDVLNEDGIAYRGLFLIDKEGTVVIKSLMIYPWEEVLLKHYGCLRLCSIVNKTAKFVRLIGTKIKRQLQQRRTVLVVTF